MVEMEALNAEHCFKIFLECIRDYHGVDDAECGHKNPYKEPSLEWYLYQKNLIDTVQWHYEDLIRVPSLPDSEVVAVKRKIDRSNQMRTDIVEKLDDWVVERFKHVKIKEGARLNTESVAWVVDRMSILTLKIYHMKQEVARDAGEEHTIRCQAKLEILLEQKADLSRSFDELVTDISRGDREVKIYRQMKMYNDESLNPALYGKTDKIG